MQRELDYVREKVSHDVIAGHMETNKATAGFSGEESDGNWGEPVSSYSAPLPLSLLTSSSELVLYKLFKHHSVA